jgi:hypothetical protein
MINQVINDWWVIELIGDDLYKCQWPNGNVRKIRGADLRTGNIPKYKSKADVVKKYTYLGASLTIAELSKLSGIAKSTLRRRIEHLGWDIVKAMTTPLLVQVNNTRRYETVTEVTYNGVVYKLSELALIHDVPYHTFRHRINAGWPIELAIDRNATYRGKGGTREYTQYELREKYTIEGTEYSLEELAYKFKIGAKTFLNRLKAGLTPDEAVVHRPYEYIEYTYLGESNSLGYFAKKYGINKATLHTRLKAGWSLEEALSRSPLPPKARRFGRSYDLRDRNQQ